MKPQKLYNSYREEMATLGVPNTDETTIVLGVQQYRIR